MKLPKRKVNKSTPKSNIGIGRKRIPHKHVIGYCNKSSKVKTFRIKTEANNTSGGLNTSVKSSGLLFAYNPYNSYNEMKKKECWIWKAFKNQNKTKKELKDRFFELFPEKQNFLRYLEFIFSKKRKFFYLFF